MNDQLNQSGQLSNSWDGCQTNSRRYDSFTTGPVRSAIPSNSWASCYTLAGYWYAANDNSVTEAEHSTNSININYSKSTSSISRSQKVFGSARPETGHSLTHPSTNRARRGVTSVNGTNVTATLNQQMCTDATPV